MPGRHAAGDDHTRRRRRELGRVLEQLRHGVREVGRGVPDDLDVGWDAGGVDAAELGGLGHRAAHDVEQRHRGRVREQVVLAREHEEAVGVAAHPRGEVVEREQRGEPVRVPLAALEVLDERQLARLSSGWFRRARFT